MGRALKYLFRLAVLAALGLVAYAYLHELPPPTRPVEVELAVPPADGQPAPAEPAAPPASADGATGETQE